MPTAIGAALSVLTAERAGAGSGLRQAVRQVGGTVGVAVLGTVLDSGYRGRARTGRLPAALAQSVHDSVAGGVAVARELHDDALTDNQRSGIPLARMTHLTLPHITGLQSLSSRHRA